MLAKDAFNVASDYAHKWSSDAEFVSADNFFGSQNDDGSAERWVFNFSSKSLKKTIKVNVVDGKVLQDLDGIYSDTFKVIDYNWVDSDVVFQNLKKILNGKKAKNYWAGLSGDSWRIKCKVDGKYKWFEFDARTGEFKK